MNKPKQLPPEVRAFLPEIFEEISEKLTPEFSKEDWFCLYDRAMEGDLTSMEMLASLFKGKVKPYIKPELFNSEEN